MGKSRDRRRYEDGEEDVIEKYRERRGRRIEKEHEQIDDRLAQKTTYDARYDD